MAGGGGVARGESQTEEEACRAGSFYRWPESCSHSGTSVLSSCSFCYYGVSTVGRTSTSGSCENQGVVRYNLGTRFHTLPS